MSWGGPPAWPVEATQHELVELGRLIATEAAATRAMWFALRPVARLTPTEWRQWRGRKLRTLTAELLRRSPGIDPQLRYWLEEFDRHRAIAQKQRRAVMKMTLANELRHGDGCIYAGSNLQEALEEANAAMRPLTNIARVVLSQVAELISKGRLEERPDTERGPTMKIRRRDWRV